MGWIIATLILFAVGVILAVNGLSIPWWTVDGGGDVSTGDDYILSGTAGQPDAGQTNGGDYILNSGFWPGSAPPPPQFRIFLPTVVSQTANTSSPGFR
jgi:hypothetical protein